jgi:hypothetical protein
VELFVNLLYFPWRVLCSAFRILTTARAAWWDDERCSISDGPALDINLRSMCAGRSAPSDCSVDRWFSLPLAAATNPRRPFDEYFCIIDVCHAP